MASAPETPERPRAIGGRQLRLAGTGSPSSAAQFVLQAPVLVPRVAQHEVVAEEAGEPLRTASSTRASGVTAVTAHTRISRTSWLLFTW